MAIGIGCWWVRPAAALIVIGALVLAGLLFLGGSRPKGDGEVDDDS